MGTAPVSAAAAPGWEARIAEEAMNSLASVAAAGAWAGDAREGRLLAQRRCSSCHYLDSQARAPDAAPPFAQVADEAAYPDARLRGWLTDPDPPMPDPGLGRNDIDNIIAYIRTLDD